MIATLNERERIYDDLKACIADTHKAIARLKIYNAFWIATGE